MTTSTTKRTGPSRLRAFILRERSRVRSSHGIGDEPGPGGSRDRAEQNGEELEVDDGIGDTDVLLERADSVPRRHRPADTVDTAMTPGMHVAAAWAWRFLVIAAAAVVIVWALGKLAEVVVPVIIGVLLAALLAPLSRILQRAKLPAGPAAGLTVLFTIAFVGGLLTLVGTSVRSGFDQMEGQVTAGFRKLRDLARFNLSISDAQMNEYWQRIKDWSTSANMGSKAFEVGTTATHVLAGLVLSLFCLFFFLYQGNMIWSWLVRLTPLRAREKVDQSGRRAWVSLTAFVRATVIVAAVDAIFISIGAAAIGLPIVSAIGALTFISAFVPIIGAFVSGLVAVLIALVAKGSLVWALIMLGIVVAVQQIESHVLQPFLMGHAVSVHPLAVILAIATGVVLAGIVGALIAVPIAAVLNAVIKYLAGMEEEDDAVVTPGPA